jgi:hypothetical protein
MPTPPTDHTPNYSVNTVPNELPKGQAVNKMPGAGTAYSQGAAAAFTPGAVAAYTPPMPEPKPAADGWNTAGHNAGGWNASPTQTPPEPDYFPNHSPNRFPKVVTNNHGGRYIPPPRSPRKANSSAGIIILIVFGVVFLSAILPMIGLMTFGGNTSSDIAEYTAMPIEAYVDDSYADGDIAVEFGEPSAVMTPYSQTFDTPVSDMSINVIGSSVTIIRDGELKIEADNGQPGIFDVDFTDGILSLSAFGSVGNVTIHLPEYTIPSIYINVEDDGYLALENITAENLTVDAHDSYIRLSDNTVRNNVNISANNCTYSADNNVWEEYSQVMITADDD